MSFELYLEPEKLFRNPKNGRLLKGHTPHNKGKKAAEYTSKKNLKKMRENLRKGSNMDKSYIVGVRSIPIVAIKDGELVGTFKSASDAERKTGILSSNIRAACLGKRKTAGGFQWFNDSDNTWCELINKK